VVVRFKEWGPVAMMSTSGSEQPAKGLSLELQMSASDKLAFSFEPFSWL
jgi:hypothetical protein